MKKNRLISELEDLQLRAVKIILERASKQFAQSLKTVGCEPGVRRRNPRRKRR